MKTSRPIILVLAVIVAMGVTPSGVAQTATVSTVSKVVQATLVIGKDDKKEDKEVDLVGREKNVLFYRPRGGPAGASTTIKFQDITEGEFVIELDNDAVSDALAAEKWPAAAALLIPVTTPLLPYLDIPGNNGVGLAMQAGQAMLKSARDLVKTGGAVNLERATNVFLRAHQMFKAVGAIEWTPDADLARLNGVQCLIALGDIKTATKDLDAVRSPDPGDDSFGLYWLTQAQLLYVKGATRQAMDAAVKSLVFDNKNLGTFPDALFMTGRCYEDMLEWHRARDVYYEIAKLFPATSYATIARDKLKYLMDKGVTKEKETSPIEVVFFGLDEDMNVKVQSLLRGDDDKAGAPVAEPTIDDLEADAPAVEKAKKETDPEAPPPDEPPPAAPQKGDPPKAGASK